MPRAFVAIDPPLEIKERLAGLRAGLAGARWMTAENLHLTLRFLGELDGADMADLREALAGIEFESFEIKLSGLGHFPPRQTPTRLWIGAQKSESLTRLRNKVERATVSVGLPPDGHKFSPHITLARLNDASEGRVAQYFQFNALFPELSFIADRFHLYTSFPGSEQAIHEIDTTFRAC